MTKLKNISRFVLAAAVALAQSCVMQSCDDNTLADTPDGSGGDTGGTNLVLRVSAADLTEESRALTPGIEKIHSLRVVLVDDAGIVEHNYHTTFSLGTEQHTYVFALTPGKKRIYLIANEESVTDLTSGRQLTEILSDAVKGTAGFGQTIDGVVFRPDYQRAIPMSALYDLEVVRGRNERVFYLVRAATKFTFHFENTRDEEVKIRKIIISKTADNSYLMAHVADSDLYPTAEDGSKVWWIDWLRDVAEKTTATPSNPANSQLNGRLGWIKNYSLPENSVTDDYVIDFGAAPLTVPASISDGDRTITGVKNNVGPFYSTESRYNPSAETGEQAYTVSFDIEGAGVLTRPLTELKALFRNTHVVTDVLLSRNIRDLTVTCTVDVQPFSSVVLRPDFGLERDDEKKIVNRDKDGYLTDDNGNYVDAYGNPATLTRDEAGNVVDFRDYQGYRLNKDGYPLDNEGQAGYRDETEKRVRNHMGYIMDKDGNLIDSQGNPAYRDTTITDRYVVRDRYGYLIDYEGNLIDKDGNPAERRSDGKVYRKEDGKEVDKNGNVA